MSQDLLRRGSRRVLFRNATMDFTAGWMLGLAQQGGMSPGALLHTFGRIRDGSPRSWTAAFTRAADAAHAASDWGAAQVAWRAALAMLDPESDAAEHAVDAMGRAFAEVVAASPTPLEPWQVPFGPGVLPAWVSPRLADADRLVVIIGGGDTYVEDLWFLGGRSLLAAGHAVLLVDLPGQGDTPRQGFHYGPDTLAGLAATLDAARARGFAGDVVLVGWSGGGVYTTKYASVARPSDRVVALVASTPVHDVAALFRAAMPGLLRRPGSPSARLALALARRNRVLRVALARYAWQAGPGGIAGVLERSGAQARTDLAALDVPVLALVGEAEDAELARQARTVVDAVSSRHPASTLVTFDGWSGGAAHCQVGNLPGALAVVTRWLAALPR